ncbi:MAG: hypothetical protein HKO53_02795 [Gemmatimonadetes bacterium]|nr:hypothetical protein [Gemmatimonadota bacterium]
MMTSQLILPAGIPPNPARRCEWCGATYEPYSRRASVQRYCGRSCADEAWSAVKRAKRSKRTTRGERILARLREGPATTGDLMAIGGSGWRSRLQELRDGKVDRVEHEVRTESHGDYAVYTLEVSRG